MVEAGELRLSASLDTSDVERGNRRIKQGFNDVQSETLSTNTTFSRLGGTVAGIAGTFAKLGVAGFSALTAIGLKSPVVADELAKIKVSAFELGNTVGRELEPALDTFNELIQIIDEGLKGDAGSWFGAIADSIVSLPLGLLRDVNNAMDALSDFFGGDDNDKNDKIDKILSKGTGTKLGETKFTPIEPERMSLMEGFSSVREQWREQGFIGSYAQDLKELWVGIGSGIVNKFSEFSGEQDRKNIVLNSPD